MTNDHCQITIEKYFRGFLCATLLTLGLIASSGCQMWHSSSAIPGMASKQGERKVLREAKNDPFPSPSDVGLMGAK